MSVPRLAGRFSPLAGWLLWIALAPTASAQDEDVIGLADVKAYRDALVTSGDDRATPASFLDLWDRPETFRGRWVRVEGRVERRFRQAARGDFPALTELWILDAAGNPICLVFPTTGAGEPGDEIVFDGRFVRIIRYRGPESERLAPLVVGPDPPTLPATPKRQGLEVLPDAAGLEVWIAALLAVVVVTILGLQHVKRRSASRPVYSGPPPEFLTGEDGSVESAFEDGEPSQ